MKNLKRNATVPTLAAAALLAVSLGTSAGAVADEQGEYSGKFKDAWLDGRIETAFALNQHLNPFVIDTKVEGGVVRLEGTVESDIDRDLAEEIARNVDGVSKVDNRLEVGPDDKNAMAKMGDKARGAANGFMGVVSDATITATVKSRLVANGNTKGLSINVDTKDEVVTLSGEVDSAEERELAAALAKNSHNVKSVKNDLVVASQQ